MSQPGAKKRRKAADEAPDAIEERLRLIIDTIPAIVWRKSPDGSADFLNRKFREYTGLSLEEGLGWGWMKPFHPDDRRVEEWRADLAVGKPFEKEARLRRADGQYRWFLLRAEPLLDEQGNVVKWYGTSTDIDDLKRAEDRARLIIDTIPMMAWTVRPDGVVDFLNQRWLDYAGRSLEEHIEDPNRVIHPDDLPRVMKRWLANMAAGEPFEDEMRLRRVDGEYRWFLVRTDPLRDEQGNIVKWYGVSLDIEDRKRAQEELQRLSGQLLRLQEEERRRIARDLHDSTGQELVALATTLSQLHASVPTSNRKLRKLASQCQALADQCIREVRTLSYLLYPPMLDESGLEDAIRHYASGFTERTGIEVELEISPRLGRLKPHVELALFRIVQESLTNIQRHSGSSQAKIRIERDAGTITLEINDKGSGISGTLQNGKLPFGSGVGIPSMHERATQIGGQLAIESSKRGTTVRVTIPADE
jgi:PAS domain S-box-containing protein